MTGPNERERRTDLAYIAATMFAKASDEFPGATSFQGTRLAQMSIREGYNPLILGGNLLANRKEIDRLVKTANAVHIVRNVTDRKGNPIPPVTDDILREIIEADFFIANGMVLATEQVRSDFLNLFPLFTKASNLVGPTKAEDAFRVIVGSLMDETRLNFEEIDDRKPTISTSSGGLDVVIFVNN